MNSGVVCTRSISIEHNLMEQACISWSCSSRCRLKEDPKDSVHRSIDGVNPIGDDLPGEKLLATSPKIIVCCDGLRELYKIEFKSFMKRFMTIFYLVRNVGILAYMLLFCKKRIQPSEVPRFLKFVQFLAQNLF